MISETQRPDTSRLPMSRLAARKRFGRGSAVLGTVAAAILVTLGVPASALQSGVESVGYQMTLDPQDQTVCLGSTAYIGVHIVRTLTIDGVPEPIVGERDGGEISAGDLTDDIARLVNDEARIPRGGRFALFAIETFQAGEAAFQFWVTSTGDAPLINYDLSAMIPVVGTVRVVQCWEAFTSGLGKVWEEEYKYVCTLERPFLLNGVWPGHGGSEPIYYMPDDPTHGRFVLINTVQQTWIASGSGTYEVVFHTIGATVEEGNIVMTGTGIMTDGNLTLEVNPMNSEVAIKPTSNPDECL